LILTKYNIDNLAVIIAKEKFDDLPLPCLVQVSIKAHHYLTPNQAHIKNTELKKRWKNYYKKFNPKMIV